LISKGERNLGNARGTHILLRRVEVQVQVVLRGDSNDTEHDREGREARVREPHVTRARCVDART
jgi:hypothetical protein